MNRRTLYITSMVAFIALAAVVLYFFPGVLGRTTKMRLVAGTSGSGIHDLGVALAEVFNTKVEGVRVDVVESDKVRNSLETVLNGEAELAVAFSDSRATATSAPSRRCTSCTCTSSSGRPTTSPTCPRWQANG